LHKAEEMVTRIMWILRINRMPQLRFQLDILLPGLRIATLIQIRILSLLKEKHG